MSLFILVAVSVAFKESCINHTRLNCEQEKGVEYLLQAADLLGKKYKDQIAINLVGKGEREICYRKFLEDRKISIVKIHPFTHNIETFFEKTDTVILPSVAYESFGLVLLEGMRMGIPVIGTDTEGIPEVIGRGEEAGGLIVPPRDGSAIAEAIEKMFLDKELYNELREKGKKRYQSFFTNEHMVENYYKYITYRLAEKVENRNR